MSVTEQPLAERSLSELKQHYSTISFGELERLMESILRNDPGIRDAYPPLHRDAIAWVLQARARGDLTAYPR